MLCASYKLQGQEKVDLGLLSKDNESVRYVAIGASLSAGVRDGGVYAEAQEAAFPALLAKLMGIANFRQALLPGTGTGREFAALDRNAVLDIQKVPGLFDDTQKDAQLPKVVGEVDNLAVPYQKVMHLSAPEGEPGTILPFFDMRGFTHLERLQDAEEEKKVSALNTILGKAKNADFFTFEMGLDDFLSYYNHGGFGQQISFMTQDREGYLPEGIIIAEMLRAGAKGAISNLPDINRLPAYHVLGLEKVKELAGLKNVRIERYEKSDKRYASPEDLFLAGVDLGSIGEETPIPDEMVLGLEERVDVGLYNHLVEKMGKDNNIPIVDLYALYNKVLDGNYISADGVKINPAYPGGNFFSADGLFPSALGQAVIANEFIRAINAFYKSNIPVVLLKDIR